MPTYISTYTLLRSVWRILDDKGVANETSMILCYANLGHSQLLNPKMTVADTPWLLQRRGVHYHYCLTVPPISSSSDQQHWADRLRWWLARSVEDHPTPSWKWSLCFPSHDTSASRSSYPRAVCTEKILSMALALAWHKTSRQNSVLNLNSTHCTH